MKTILITLVLGLALQAQPYASNRYGGSYAARISQGERTGQLTRSEAARLWSMERHLRQETERSYRDGRGLSQREAARLDSLRFNLDRELSRQLRDGDRSYGYRR